MKAHSNQQTPLRVLQLTDTHLGERAGDTLLGMDTDRSLDFVLGLAAEEYPQPDLLLLTGDIASDGQRGAYQRARERMHGVAGQCAWLPGNHDLPEEMEAADFGGAWTRRRIDLGSWQILLLDSSVPGQVHGELGERELAFLQQALAEHPRQYTMVCLHHHVLPVGCDWLDQQRVSNHRQLLELLVDYPGARLLLSGHVHQYSDQSHAHLRVLTTPSTCVQFKPDSKRFAVDNNYPGYRWFELFHDGSVRTGVSRVHGVHFTVDRQALGY